ncbi:XrtA system polysaccharide chain length determinant [Pelagibius sp. Alg239-R121]|uniref:XrtA system polysaccharide chain length determinant n=1 Tax=Pelagibius sp. Alg239-R121 TaxID=2993448 RepID=UPI0024A739CC|nr:XrtA system polysaccharide chain length determinant [Pelagibius sp. Alg239-R121]
MSDIYAQFIFYCNAVWQRRWYAMITAWLVCIGGWFYVATIPDVYVASGRLYVDTASMLRPLLQGLAVDTNIRSEIRLMQQTLLSRPNLQKVARMTDLDITATTPDQMERLIERLDDKTRVQSNGGNLFKVSFEDGDPVRARDVVDALLTIFVEGNLGQSRDDMDTAQRFIGEQIKDYERQLEQAEERLANFKQQNFDALPGAAGYHGRVERAESGLVSAENNLNAAITQRALLQRELASVPELIGGASNIGLSSGPPSDTTLRIIEIEAQIQELLTRYTEKHPDVVIAQRRLAALEAKNERELEAALESELSIGDQPAEETGVPNPLYAQMQLRLIEQQSIIQINQRRVDQIKGQIEELERLRANVPAVEAELKKLNRDYAIIKTNYDELLKRRESARLSQEREVSAEPVQFRIVDPPEIPALPDGPNRGLFLTVVLFAGLGAGVGLSWVMIFIQDTFHDASNLGAAFALPVLGTVTAVQDLTKRGWGFSKLAGTAIVLVAMVGTYGSLMRLEQQVGLSNLDIVRESGNIPAVLNETISSKLMPLISGVFGDN